MYKLRKNSILRLSDMADIPIDNGNRDYREYKEWLAEGGTPEPEFTEAELQERAKVESKQTESNTRDELMLDGNTYTLNGIDYKVSFTKDDGDGMVQVKNGFDLGLNSTIIHFDSGTKMPITSSEFLEFAKWFVVERNKFFNI